MPDAFGFQEVRYGNSAVPSAVAFNAAILFLVVPATVVKLPPIYKVLPSRAIVKTIPVATPGFQSCSVPSLLILANRFLVTPPTDVKSPPMYQPPLPSGNTARTAPLGAA